METLSLTEHELIELVKSIATEVLGEANPSAGSETGPAAIPGGPAAAVSAFGGTGGPTSGGIGDRVGIDPGAIRLSPDVRKLARLVDHTLLRPEASRAEVERHCEEARRLEFAAASVNPAWVPLAATRLRGSAVKVATVVGFPFGATFTAAKRAEAEAALRAGAQEIDMVMNVGAMKSGESERVEMDIRAIVEMCHAGGALVKVILENAYLSAEEKVRACRLAQRAGADFVKTSTGFGPSGASEADVRLMRETVGESMGVKAAGGIRTLSAALRLLQAGATRLGMSASVAVLAEAARIL